MADALEDALDKNLPPGGSPGIRSQIDTFLGYFEKDLEKGDSMELTYVPGVGTALMQNREQQGATMPGKGRHPVGFLFQFRNLLFGAREADSRPIVVASVLPTSCGLPSSETCCSGLEKQILDHCSPSCAKTRPF